MVHFRKGRDADTYKAEGGGRLPYEKCTASFSIPRQGKRGDATTAGEKTVGFSPKEWQLWGDARGGILNTPLAALWVLSRTGKYRTAGSYRED